MNDPFVTIAAKQKKNNVKQSKIRINYYTCSELLKQFIITKAAPFCNNICRICNSLSNMTYFITTIDQALKVGNSYHAFSYL